MNSMTVNTDPRQAAEELDPETVTRVRISTQRATRIREFIRSHLLDHMDIEVVITPHVATAAVLPADIETILGAEATDVDREQAECLLNGVDADYLVLVTAKKTPLDRIPLNDQLTADHAHQFGLAFHELLHILKTAIVAISQLLEEEIDEQYHEQVHDLINIIEDGAIESEAIHGENFSDNAGIRLELTRRIHSQTPEDIPDGQQVHYSFWDAVTSTLYDAAIYPTSITEVLLDPDDNRIVFKSDADQRAFGAVYDALKQLAEDALAIKSADPEDTTHSHDKKASVLRAKRVIKTWKTAIHPVLENQRAQEQKQPSEGQQDRDGGSRDEPDKPTSAAPELGPDPLPEDFDPGDVSLDREATDDPYQDVFEHPAVTSDPDPEDVDDIEDLQSDTNEADEGSPAESDADGSVSAVDSGSPFDEEAESGSTTSRDADGRDDDTADREPQWLAQALAEAAERAREKEQHRENDNNGERSGQNQPGDDSTNDQSQQESQSSNSPDRDQLSFDDFETSSSGDDTPEVEPESQEPAQEPELSEQEASETESDLDTPDGVPSSSGEGNQELEPEARSSSPAHARSSERSPEEDQETYEDVLDADRRAAHDEADREGIDQDALERELKDLAHVLDREQRRREDTTESKSSGGNSGGPGNLDEIDLLPITDELVPPRDWATIEEGAHQVAGTLEKELRLERQRGERTGLTAGTYDTRSGHRLAIGDPRVCKTRTPGRKKRYCLVLILDRSRSMRNGSPPKIEVATQALARFAVAAEALGINIAIIDFIRGNARLVKPFSVETRHVQATLLDTSCGGGTPLADAIGLARQLIESQRDKPLIITVTDDEPRSVEAVKEQIRTSHAPICSLTIATDCEPGTLSPDASELAAFYERQAAVYTPERLDDRLDQFASLLAGF